MLIIREKERDETRTENQKPYFQNCKQNRKIKTRRLKINNLEKQRKEERE